METLNEKFNALRADFAPGQEVRQNLTDLKDIMCGQMIGGALVDFSHGDVDAFRPTPGSEDLWIKGFKRGGCQAYTEYRGDAEIRAGLAKRLGKFTGQVIDSEKELLIAPGTQGALFLALGATVTNGTKVAIVQPDYFANRKLVKFFGGKIVPIPLIYKGSPLENGPDLKSIKKAFKTGTQVFVFSTPNNPTGIVYSESSIKHIAALAAQYNITIIVDQLYSRMLYHGEKYTHFRNCDVQPKNLLTIMGPSKTESLSGYRLGVAFGTPELIDRMERLQAIVSLRAAGYNQMVLHNWFQEPKGWLEKRIIEHQTIRDDLLKILNGGNIPTPTPQAGSYLFAKLPPLKVDLNTFVRLLRYQANVIVTPGNEFDPHCHDSIRLNFSQNPDMAKDAALRIVKMTEIYKK